MTESRSTAVMLRFLPRFLPLVAVVAAGALLEIRARDSARLTDVTSDERAFVQGEVGRIEATMASAAADALFLSELAFQSGIGGATSTGSLDALSVELLTFLRSRVAFDRVALLDAQGMERLRMDRTPAEILRVLDAELEDHGAHDHFLMVAGSSGLTWLSPTDRRGEARGNAAAGSRALLVTRAIPGEGRGFEAHGVARATALLKERWLQGHPVQLCLLDAEMPELDGYALAGSIKDDPELGSPKVIMLTSHGEGRSRDFQAEIGMSGHMTKPVRRSTLLHAVARALAEAPRAEARAVPSVGAIALATPLAPPLPPLHILVVDDSPDNRMLLRAYLKKTPHVVEFAENGEEAVKACADEDPFDLVFMDMQMPVLDGYEATKAIRRRESATTERRLRIVALSAYALKEEVQKSLDAGCDDHLTKPIKKVRILEAIEEAQVLRSVNQPV